MRIENTTGVTAVMQSPTSQGMDATEKNLQNQIGRKEQELQKLSENENMSMEEKMKKRQEIQKEISELNMQLRQHQMEKRREQQNKSSMDDMLGGKQNAISTREQNAGLSQNSMKAVLSAGTSIKQAQVQGSVATKMEGRANILKSEIKNDGARGNTEAKEAELASLEQKAMNAKSSQMDTLRKANQSVDEAAKAERESGKTESRMTESNKAESGKTERDKTESNNAKNGKTISSKTDKTGSDNTKSGKTESGKVNASKEINTKQENTDEKSEQNVDIQLMNTRNLENVHVDVLL